MRVGAQVTTAAGIDETDETAEIVANATETATGHTALHLLRPEATDTVTIDTAIDHHRHTTEVAGSAEVLVQPTLTTVYLCRSARLKTFRMCRSSPTRISTGTSSTGSRRPSRVADSRSMSST
jgi:hypothetical protein